MNAHARTDWSVKNMNLGSKLNLSFCLPFSIHCVLLLALVADGLMLIRKP